jgi:uncharacterized membrane protein
VRKNELTSLILGFALSGIVVSAYLLLLSMSTTALNVCPSAGCEQVITSPYSKIAGIPLSALGLIWFVFAIIFSFRPHIILMWGVVGIGGAGYLIGIELFVLHTICLFCTTAHVLGIAIMICAIYLNKRETTVF